MPVHLDLLSYMDRIGGAAVPSFLLLEVEIASFSIGMCRIYRRACTGGERERERDSFPSDIYGLMYPEVRERERERATAR